MPAATAATAPADALVDWLQHAWAHPADDAAAAPIGARLTQLIRRAILERVVPPAHRLPSTRALALALRLARNTVVPVYEQLRAEGFVVAGQGSGTYVCRIAPDALPVAASRRSAAEAAPRAAPLAFSRRGRRYHSHPLHEFWTRQPFCPGQFDFALFPHRLWNRLQQRQLRRADPIQLEQGEPGGAPELRQAIAEHVRATRGVHCAPDQVIITDGTGESIDLVARLMCDPGDEVLLEDPGYWAATQVLSDHGLRLRRRPSTHRACRCRRCAAASARRAWPT